MAERRLMGGRYALVEAIGEGENGVVYRAVDTRNEGRMVATKVLHGNGRPDAQRRGQFREEETLLRSMDHPNVLGVLDSGTDGNTDWVVVDFARSGTLAGILDTDGPFDTFSGLQIALQMLAAIQALHHRGVAHGAVRPENLLLGHRGRIILSHFADAETKGVHAMYAGCGGAADVYAAAATLYQLLTARPAPDLTQASFSDPAWHGVEDWLQPVLRRGMAHELDERHRSAEAFAEAIVDGADRYGSGRAAELAQLWRDVAPQHVPDLSTRQDTREEEEPETTTVSRALLSVAGGILVGAALLGVASWVVAKAL